MLIDLKKHCAISHLPTLDLDPKRRRNRDARWLNYRTTRDALRPSRPRGKCDARLPRAQAPARTGLHQSERNHRQPRRRLAFGSVVGLACEPREVALPRAAAAARYVFRVPLNTELGEVPAAEPIKPMGRFSHEALAVDHAGVVYLTEDAVSGIGAGIYRYLPHYPTELQAGGALHMLGIAGQPQYDTREVRPRAWFCRWPGSRSRIPTRKPRATPARPAPSTRLRPGGAKFNRLEAAGGRAQRVLRRNERRQRQERDAPTSAISRDGEGVAGRAQRLRDTSRSSQSPGHSLIASNLIVYPRRSAFGLRGRCGRDGQRHVRSAPGLVIPSQPHRYLRRRRDLRFADIRRNANAPPSSPRRSSRAKASASFSCVDRTASSRITRTRSRSSPRTSSSSSGPR